MFELGTIFVVPPVTITTDPFSRHNIRISRFNRRRNNWIVALANGAHPSLDVLVVMEARGFFIRGRYIEALLAFLWPSDFGILASFGVSPKDSHFRLCVIWTSGLAVKPAG